MTTTEDPYGEGAMPAFKALCLGAVFLAGTTAPGLRWIVTGKPDTSVLKELRTPAPPPPPPVWGSLTKTTQGLSKWFDDRFPFRRELSRTYNWLVWRYLGTTPSDPMQRGRDGWLFLQGAAMTHYRGIDPFSPAELEAWRDVHLEYADWLAARDCRHVFLAAPDKQGVYPEYLPEWIEAEARPTRTDQILEGLRDAENGRTVAVDARALAHELKALGNTYYPLGTHWSSAGAYAGYRAIVDALAESFPAIRPLELADLEQQGPDGRPEGWIGDTWLERCHIEDRVPQTAIDFLQAEPGYRIVESAMNRIGLVDGATRHVNRELPRGLLLSDSYGDAIWFFLADAFSGFAKNSVERYALTQVEELRPDAVLTLRVERFLHQPMPEHPITPEDLAHSRAWLAAEPLRTDGEAFELGSEPRPLAAPAGARWLRVERRPGAAGTLWLIGPEQPLRLELEPWRRWVFIELPQALAGVPFALRSDSESGLQVLALEFRG